MSGRNLQIAEVEPGIKGWLVGNQAHGDGTWPNVVVVAGAGEGHKGSFAVGVVESCMFVQAPI